MWDVDVENFGGIRFASAQIGPGINVIQASNFQGKSSFIRSLQAALAGTGNYATERLLTEGADHGSVSLQIEDDRFSVDLQRRNGDVVVSEETFLTSEFDRTCARLFAFLDEENPIRIAVRDANTGQDRLVDLLEAPLDLADIDAQIDTLQSTREELDEELRQAAAAKNQLPTVEEQIAGVERELTSLRERQTRLRQQRQAGTDDELAETLWDKQSTLDSIQYAIERLESQVSQNKQQLNNLRDELASLSIPEDTIDETRLQELEDEREQIELQIDLVEDLLRVNRRAKEDHVRYRLSEVDHGLEGDTIHCWVCGSTVTEDGIEHSLESLEERLLDLREQQSAIVDEISTLQTQRDRVRRRKREKSKLEKQIKELEHDIETKTAEIETKHSRKAELATAIDQLEEEIETTEQAQDDELNTVNQQLGRLEGKLEELTTRREELQEQAEAHSQLQANREELSNDIRELRTYKAEKQRELTAEFDAAIDEIIEFFEPGFDGANLVRITNEDESTTERYDLTVVRDGREIPIDNLSEGETELVGIALAVSGYKTFAVEDILPIILVDGVGQLAAEHLHRLVSYLADRAEVIVCSAYPEAGDFSGRILQPDDWTVVSDDGSES